MAHLKKSLFEIRKVNGKETHFVEFLKYNWNSVTTTMPIWKNWIFDFPFCWRLQIEKIKLLLQKKFQVSQ